MFRNCIGMLLIGVLMFIVVVGFMLLVGYGLNLLMIPCEVQGEGGFIPPLLMVYIETGLLLGIFMLIGFMIVSPTIQPMKMFQLEDRHKSC